MIDEILGRDDIVPPAREIVAHFGRAAIRAITIRDDVFVAVMGVGREPGRHLASFRCASLVRFYNALSMSTVLVRIAPHTVI